MNKARLMDLANIIEKEELDKFKFNMRHGAISDSSIDPFCGTVGCIAGAAIAAAYGNKIARKWASNSTNRLHEMPRPTGFFIEARRILGLTDEERIELFTPRGYADTDYYSLPRSVAVLRHAAATGRIEWNAFGPDGKFIEKEDRDG